jgi:hypothetical protein
MFCIDDLTAEAIRRAFDEGGELSAAVELRRHFPGIIDNANARRCARAIAGWTPIPPLAAETSQGRRLQRRSTRALSKIGK